MRYPKRHSIYGRVKVKTIQLFLGKYSVKEALLEARNYGFGSRKLQFFDQEVAL